MSSCNPKTLVLEVAGATLNQYSYATNDKADEVMQQPYWANVSSRFNLWDRILVNSLSGGKPHSYTLVVVYCSRKSGIKVALESAVPPGAVQE